MINYSTGTWDADSLGYHRVVLRVEKKAEDVFAHIEWRRRDKDPEKKGFILIDGKTGQRVLNVTGVNITREAGDIVFKPVTVPGDYYLYYLPGKSSGRSNYPNTVYPGPFKTADSLWASKFIGMTFTKIAGKIPSAKVTDIEARDEFNSFYPMEVIATKIETEQLVNEYPEKDFLVFSEDRSLSIRMKDDLPLKWITDNPSRPVVGNVMKGEYFTFQLGVYATKKALNNVSVRFSDLKGSDNNIVIPSSELACFNRGGRNWDNTLFTKQVNIEKGTVQAFWCGVMIPEGIGSSSLKGSATVTCDGFNPETVDIKIEVSNKIIANHGDNEPWNMTRLRWLNSDMAFNDELIKPFTQIKREGNKLTILGFKPRTSPYSFQGMEEEGLKLLKKVGEKMGMPVVTEVMNTTDVDLIEEYSDILQIGARNVQNFALLKKVGRSRRPVLLKRGMMTTIEELLMSAEYILSEGNEQVILCERGIRTFETATRNTLDISAVPVLKELTHLPVIIDPSHACGPCEIRHPPHPGGRGRGGGRRHRRDPSGAGKGLLRTVPSRSGRSSSTGSWTRSTSWRTRCATGSGGFNEQR